MTSHTSLSPLTRAFLEHQRVGHLATASKHAEPSVVPVCYTIGDTSLYIGIDAKPKRADVFSLRRLTNLRDNPRASVCVDHYEEDWRQLGFVLLRGSVDLLLQGTEHAKAQANLAQRYPQLLSMQIDALPVIALRIQRVTTWGELSLGTAQGTRFNNDD